MDRLMAEHPDFLGELRVTTADILERSEGHVQEDPALRTRVGSVRGRLESYERAETRMILRSELREVGIGD
jgi:hypothetical protein